MFICEFFLTKKKIERNDTYRRCQCNANQKKNVED